MNKYEITIEDIYDSKKAKKIALEGINVYMVHKQGLKHTNALREEISKITLNGRVVYTFKSGFSEE